MDQLKLQIYLQKNTQAECSDFKNTLTENLMNDNFMKCFMLKLNYNIGAQLLPSQSLRSCENSQSSRSCENSQEKIKIQHENWDICFENIKIKITDTLDNYMELLRKTKMEIKVFSNSTLPTASVQYNIIVFDKTTLTDEILRVVKKIFALDNLYLIQYSEIEPIKTIITNNELVKYH